jgi:succinate dehydrogenase / fumarate reductase cytochrome b subunit
MNSKAFMEGKEALGETFSFTTVVHSVEGIHPWRAVLNGVEILFILLPLLLHGLYGFVIWWQGKSNVFRHGYVRNWMYTLQRWSGLVIFVFLILHVWRMRLSNTEAPDLAWAPADVFPVLHEALQNPFVLGLYILGVIASAMHFANGLWLAGITWGLTIGPRSQKISTAVALGVFVLLLLLGGLGLYGFAALEPATTVAAH